MARATDDIVDPAPAGQPTLEEVAARAGRREQRAAKRLRRSGNRAVYLWFLLAGTMAAFAIFGAALAPHDLSQLDLRAALLPPGSTSDAGFHLLGTDQLGRDVLSRVIVAARLTLAIGAVATVIGGVIGVLVGLAAGFYGGRIDRLVMRSAEAQIAMPNFLIAIFLLAILGPNVLNLLIVLPMFVWPIYARILRAEALILRESPFVEAARAIGCSGWTIIRRHLVPNVASRIAILSVVELGHVILSEAMLSFLGIGVQPPQTTWGLLVAQGRPYLAVAWWLVAFPGLALFLTVLSVNMISRKYAKRVGSAG